MTEELTELHEHAEHAREHPDLAPVTLTMAVLAVLVATVSLMGHRTHTEEIILQNKVTDQWAYYQAKNIRRHNDEMFADLLDAHRHERRGRFLQVPGKVPRRSGPLQRRAEGARKRSSRHRKRNDAHAPQSRPF